jgi:hypothetical protein
MVILEPYQVGIEECHFGGVGSSDVESRCHGIPQRA